MSTPIIVVGHRNPDNDSIGAAVAYAYLKNQLVQAAGNPEDVEYLPARLGPLPPESEAILAEAGIEAPVVIAHVHPRVGDVMTANPVTISADATVLEAGRLLRKHNIRSLVVEDAEGKFRGLIATRAIANRYIEATDLLDSDPTSDERAVAEDLMASLTQKVSELTDTNILVFDTEALLGEAIEDIMRSDLREAVILNDDDRCIGIITRSDFANRPKRQVVLVDHNETRQAAPGIEEADVVEIIDHHRIADVSTANPIQFINMPVGSTATIVTGEFIRHGVDIPAPMAKVLLSAIVTDTVILKSPTTTDVDRERARFLADIIGVDPTEFGLTVFRMKGGQDDMSVEELVEADSKEFQIGDATVLIAQRETVDLPAIMAREDEIREHMRKLQKENDYEFVLLMVTDILAEGSQFLCEGNRRIVNRVFGIECTGEGGTWMPGILSRKKQVAAKILG